MKNIGVTGTRYGLTDRQKFVLAATLASHLPESFRHGDAVGADDEAAEAMDSIRRLLGLHTRIVCHPPSDEKLRAFNKRSDEILSAKTHFARNRDIVDACDLLIVLPLQNEWQPRGGTFFTHDWAVKKNRPVLVIWPDGSTSGPAEKGRAYGEPRRMPPEDAGHDAGVL